MYELEQVIALHLSAISLHLRVLLLGCPISTHSISPTLQYHFLVASGTIINGTLFHPVQIFAVSVHTFSWSAWIRISERLHCPTSLLLSCH